MSKREDEVWEENEKLNAIRNPVAYEDNMTDKDKPEELISRLINERDEAKPKEYKKYEFCQAVKCKQYEPALYEHKEGCFWVDRSCDWSYKEFMEWIEKNNYKIVKEE